MNIKKTLGEKIKRLRKQKKLTQEQLAELIDIAPKNLSKIERGANFVTAETLGKLLVALNTTTEKLFSNDNIKEKNELISDIYSMVDNLKNDRAKLELIYRMLENISEF